MRIQRFFKAASPLPAVLTIAALFEVSRLEGWNGWAFAASVVPILLGFSVVMSLAGVTLWLVERRRGIHAPSLLVATLVAALPCLAFMVRVAFMEFAKGR